MKTLKLIKKIIAVAAIASLTVGLIGCSVPAPVVPADIEPALVKLNELDQKLGDLAKVVASLPSPVEPVAQMPETALADVQAVAVEEGAIPEVTEVVLHEFAEIDGLKFGESVESEVLDSRDLSFLNSGKFELDGEKIDYKELLMVNDGFELVTSLVDKSLGDEPALFFEKGALSYKLVFKDEVDMSLITVGEPFEINFMGFEWNIIEASSDEISVLDGVRGVYKVGDKLQIGDKEWEVYSISKDHEVVLKSTNEVKRISEGGLKSVGGMEVYAEEVIYDEDVPSLAFLRIGKDVIKEFSNDDEFDELGEDYKFHIEANGDSLVSLSVSYDVRADKAEEALKLGETLDFGGFAELSFELEDEIEATEFVFSFSEVEDTNVLKISCGSSRCIEVADEEMNVAYLAADGSVFYKNDEGKWDNVVEELWLVNDEMSFQVGVTDGVVSVAGFSLVASDDFSFLGVEADEAEEAELVFGSLTLGEREEDLLLNDGVILRSPEKNAGNDKVVLEIPSEEPSVVLKLGR